MTEQELILNLADWIERRKDHLSLSYADHIIHSVRHYEAEIQRCHERLEITHVYRPKGETGEFEPIEIPYEERAATTDGIECRDATIQLLQDEISSLRQKLEKAREECARRGALVPLAYGEGILDVGARGATIDSAGEKYETSDAKACLDDPECHRSEFPDNYDDALNSARYAMSQEGE